MKDYCSLFIRFDSRFVSELQYYDTHEEAARALASLYKQRLGHAWWFGPLVTMGLLIYCFVLIPILPLSRYLAVQLIYAASFVVGVWCAYCYFFGGQERFSLRLQLRDIGLPLCATCGYNYRFDIQSRCPQCGVPADDGLLNMKSKRNLLCRLQLPDDRLEAEARRRPLEWIYCSDEPGDCLKAAPAERMIGAFKSGKDGQLTGQFKPNPNYRPVSASGRTSFVQSG